MALADVFEQFAGPDAPVEFRAYDGSRAGAEGCDVRITVKSPTAVKYLAQAPGAMGLARAYVSGHLDLDGDMYTALARMASAQRMDLSVAERLGLLRQLGGPRMLFPRVSPQVAVGPTALQGQGRHGDLAPLRRLEHVLRVGARPVDGLHVRLLPE
jgi:cyclopropane-fatty-acyl-phospholipid synthase